MGCERGVGHGARLGVFADEFSVYKGVDYSEEECDMIGWEAI